MEYESARHLLHRSRSTQWFGTDHTVNLYRGCCHGCLYCDSRSDCYRVGDFDRVRGKRDALRILRDDLARKVRPAFINMGAMSDPYNPFEGELLFTRHALELIDAYGCGVAVATKSDLITRDIDLLGAIQEHAPVVCKLTVTTTDETLAARLEPNAPSPARRLEALRALSSAGIFSGALLMPVLPFLEDSDENVLAVVEEMTRIALAQEKLAEALTSEDSGPHADAESRMRLRSIDVQLLRILEEISAGRQETLADLRGDLSALTQSVRQLLRGRV